MEAMWEKARDVGRLLAQTDEFKALKRANDQLSNDREAVTLLQEMEQVQGAVTNALRAGREPTEEEQTRYEELLTQIQQKTVYQSVVAAQSNFDRIMMRINEEIAKGIDAAEQSRIILPS